MKKSLLIIVFISFLSIVTIAQDEYNKGEFFAGFSSGQNLASDELSPEPGFNVSAVYNFHKYIGVKADVSGAYQAISGSYYFPNSTQTNQTWNATHNIYNFTAGVQIKDNRKDSIFRPFGHFLVGYGKHFDKIKTACPSNAKCPPIDLDLEGVSYVLGGGLDFKLNDRIDIRAAQFDINPINSRDKGIWNNGRFSAGIVFKF